MTPQEKAKQLVDNMMPFVYIDKSIGQYFNGKHCALIAVDEILSFIEDDRESFSWKTYYQEVKQEIEAL